jgi:dolichol-phosphate mannosyltransferase
MSVCVVVPAYNEEQHIADVVKAILAVHDIDCVYVVNDGSSDNTSRLAGAAGAIVIDQPKNMGVGAALRSGFIRAREDKFDIAIVMGGDSQDNPRQIPRLLKLVDEGFDVVQGSRWLKGGDTVNIPLFRRVTTKLYAFIIRLCTGFPFTDGTNGFRAIRLSVFDKIDLDAAWLNRYELEPYILYKAVVFKFRVAEAAVTKSYNIKKGYTKMVPLLDWWRILRPLIFLRLGIKK